MTRDRPWRSAFEPWDALRQAAHGAGHQFDPAVVDALTATLREQRVSTPFSGLDTTVRGRRSPVPVPARAYRPLVRLPREHLSPILGVLRHEPATGRLGPGTILEVASRRTRADSPLAKDTEKLIRQLSLISFLMAERRPVSALEIKQDVEGYSEMNDDAFARRFYADRAELEALGIYLKVEKPPEGYFEAELYTLPPENFYLPPIEFTTASSPRFRPRSRCSTGASPTPSRCGSRSSSSRGAGRARSARAEQRSVAVAVTASAGGRELSQRLAKVETAISRRKTIEFGYYSIERDEHSKRKVDPYHLLYQGGQFYLVGLLARARATCASSGSRGSGTRSPTRARPSTTSRRPTTSIPGATRSRADWQLGDAGRARPGSGSPSGSPG